MLGGNFDIEASRFEPDSYHRFELVRSNRRPLKMGSFKTKPDGLVLRFLGFFTPSHKKLIGPKWRNGRRRGFKIPRLNGRAGSSPALGTTFSLDLSYNQRKQGGLTPTGTYSGNVFITFGKFLLGNVCSYSAVLLS